MPLLSLQSLYMHISQYNNGLQYYYQHLQDLSYSAQSGFGLEDLFLIHTNRIQTWDSKCTLAEGYEAHTDIWIHLFNKCFLNCCQIVFTQITRRIIVDLLRFGHQRIRFNSVTCSSSNSKFSQTLRLSILMRDSSLIFTHMLDISWLAPLQSSTMDWILAALIRQSVTKQSEIPLEAHVNFVSPGCIFLSRNLILSLNKPLSSNDNAAMILKQNSVRLCKYISSIFLS